ncbi:LOW QUALITY PROTEIN: hypothetical protein Cgig2_021558 [Carnegiea gigantea]|uniref:Uncharacterized protein n=1 Tax=Carnegiea gigantea TaxID=171969 RepID=A0A9Q1K9M1_9CARY|nr:LOW QUALITY PROTEIN: hypothetical protein Cgig2_021558 [Carnegiea gigantea]
MSYRSKRTLNVLAAKSSTVATQSLGHPSFSTATAQPASFLKVSASLMQQQAPVLCLTSSGVLQPPTQPLQPPSVVARASAEAPTRSGHILPLCGTEAGASKVIVQQQPVGLSRSTEASTPLTEASQLPLQTSVKKSVQHVTSTRASIEVPRRSGQLPPPPSTSIKASKQIIYWRIKTNYAVACSAYFFQWRISISAIPPAATYYLHCCITAHTYAYFPNWSSTTPDFPIYDKIWSFLTILYYYRIESTLSDFFSYWNFLSKSLNYRIESTFPLLLLELPKQIPPLGSTIQASRESPSNGNNDHEDLAKSSQSQSNDKGNGHVGGKQRKSSVSKSTRSSQSSSKDNIPFDAKEEVLTIDDQGNEESKFMYPADEGFDKHVLKHVAKDFKQYKHGLKRDYFKPEEKTREDMYKMVPKGHSHDGWMRLVDYWCSKQHEVEAHGKEPTHLEFFKETHSKEGGGFVANTATEGYTFPNNNMELKHVKEELASQKAMFLLMLKVVCNGKITDEFLDATEAALHMAGNQVSEESSGNDLSNESRHTGPSTSTSHIN